MSRCFRWRRTGGRPDPRPPPALAPTRRFRRRLLVRRLRDRPAARIFRASRTCRAWALSIPLLSAYLPDFQQGPRRLVGSTPNSSVLLCGIAIFPHARPYSRQPDHALSLVPCPLRRRSRRLSPLRRRGPARDGRHGANFLRGRKLRTSSARRGSLRRFRRGRAHRLGRRRADRSGGHSRRATPATQSWPRLAGRTRPGEPRQVPWRASCAGTWDTGQRKEVRARNEINSVCYSLPSRDQTRSRTWCRCP